MFSTTELSDDDNDLCLHTQPRPNPPPLPLLCSSAATAANAAATAATPADESSDDDEYTFLTQPPSLLNTVHSSILAVPAQGFIDLLHDFIDHESEFNSSPPYTNPPTPPLMVIPDYVSSAIQKNCSSPGGVRLLDHIRSRRYFILFFGILI
jgi:hypothetical protein